MPRKRGDIAQQNSFEADFAAPLAAKERSFSLQDMFDLTFKFEGMTTDVSYDAANPDQTGRKYRLQHPDLCDLGLGIWGTVLEHWKELGTGGDNSNLLEKATETPYIILSHNGQNYVEKYDYAFYGGFGDPVNGFDSTNGAYWKALNQEGLKGFNLVARLQENAAIDKTSGAEYYAETGAELTVLQSNANMYDLGARADATQENKVSKNAQGFSAASGTSVQAPGTKMVKAVSEITPTKVGHTIEARDGATLTKFEVRADGLFLNGDPFSGGAAPNPEDPATLANYYTKVAADERFLRKDALEGNALVTTFAELLANMDNSTLSEGNWYRFKYQTVHIIQETDGLKLNVHGTVYEDKNAWPNRNNVGGNTNHPEGFEELVVFATTNNTIAPIAYSRQFPTDVIEYDPRNIWCEDTIFAADGSVQTPGTRRPGFIIKRTDTYLNNVTPYDFRTVISIRYALNPPEWVDQAYGRWSIVKTGNNIWMTYKAAPIGAAPADKSDYWVKVWEFKPGVLSRHISTYKNSFLFAGFRACPVDNNSFRYFKTWNKLTSGTDEIAEDYYEPTRVNNVVIEPWRGGLQGIAQGLNNIVFCSPFASSQPFSGNYFGGNNRYMTFGFSCANNNFDSDCFAITSCGSFIENSFGAYCQNNSFYSNCDQITAESNFRQNTFGPFSITYLASWFTNNHCSGAVARCAFNNPYFRNNVILGEFGNVSANGVMTANTFIGNVLSMTFNQWFDHNILRGNWNDFVINMYINGRTLVNNHEIHPIQYRTPLGKLVYAIVDETLSIETKELT